MSKSVPNKKPVVISSCQLEPYEKHYKKYWSEILSWQDYLSMQRRLLGSDELYKKGFKRK